MRGLTWKPDTARPHLEAEPTTWGHELSISAGVIMLFPGPLAQVRQRRRVRGANSKQSLICFHTYRKSHPFYLHSLARLPRLFIIHRVYDQYSSQPQDDNHWSNSLHLYFTCVCCVYALSVCCVWDFPELRFPAHVGVNQVVFCSLLHAFMLCELCHRMTASVALLSDSSLSAYVFHGPSFYGVLFGFQLRLSPVSICPSSQQRNPTRTVCLFVSCLFVQ